MIRAISEKGRIVFNLVRVEQWVKNLFLFTPAFFGGTLLHVNTLLEVVLAFFTFSFAASSIYIFNDLQDVEFDRLHPKKSKRPIAAGIVGELSAKIIFVFLFVSSFLNAFFINKEFGYLVAIYLLMNILYTKKLKQIAIIDLNCIAIGFVIRVLAGGVVGGVHVSKWLVIMTFLLSLFLALAKRRDDVLLEKDTGQKMRKAITGYNVHFIDQSMIVMAAVMIVGYLMYVLSPEVTARMHSDNLYFSSIFVVIGVLRYLQITFVEINSGSPTKILLSDRFTQLNLLAWVLFFFIIIYY